MKFCPSCKIRKEWHEFSSSPARSDQHDTYCKVCRAAKAKRRRKKLFQRVTVLYPQKKRCTKCGLEKAATEFCKNRSATLGLQDWCKACVREKAVVTWAALSQEEKDAKSVKVRRFVLKAKYNLSEAEYVDIVSSQNFRCPICNCELRFKGPRVSATACVDHCHKTGKVRSVLCNGCNITIGKFQESAPLLRRAAEYLEKHNNQNINNTNGNLVQ